MVSLLLYPREEALYLFHRNRLKNQSQATLCIPETLMEELKEQLTSVSFGFLGKSLSQFSCTTLMHKGANNEEEEDDDDDEDPGIHVRSSKNTVNTAASAVPIQSPHGPPQRECVTEKSLPGMLG